MIENLDLIIKVICKFLHDEKILEKFCCNYMREKHMSFSSDTKLRERTFAIVEKGILDSRKGFPPEIHNWRVIVNFFSCTISAFAWMRTPEGGEFWSRISSKWGSFMMESDFMKKILNYDNEF